MSSNIEREFAAAVAPGSDRLIAGCVVAGAGMKESEEYVQAFGTQTVSPTSAPLTPNAVMRMASCSKLLTTIACLQLVESGHLSLDSQSLLCRLLPEWSNPQILVSMNDSEPVLRPAKENMTLRQLLTHTSGMSYDFYSPLKEWRASRNEKSLVMSGDILRAFTHPLVFEPGQGWCYGPGIDLAGLMVERATGMRLGAYMSAHIFGPLGMHSCTFQPLQHPDIAARIMPMTTVIDGSGKLESSEWGSYIWPRDPKDDCGGNGVWGTAQDYVKVLKSLLRDDGKLLKPQTARMMFQPQMADATPLMDLLRLEIKAQHMTPGFPAVGKPGGGEWNHGLGGMLGLKGVEGRLREGWLQWGGSPNLKWVS